MALSASLVWECRATGSDTNGGGFVAGAAGTDRSQQDSPQVVVNNSTITATTAGANSNVITFTLGYTATSADVGNTFQATGGTNINAGVYQITAQTSSTWTVTGATNLTTAGGAGSALTGNMGGAFATPGKILSSWVASNKGFVKYNASPYQISAGLTSAAASVTPSNTSPFTRLIGYYQTRGDIKFGTNLANRPTIQLITTSGLTALTMSAGMIVENLIVDCNSLTTSTGVAFANYGMARNCVVQNFTTKGIALTSVSYPLVVDTEITGGVTGATGGIVSTTGNSIAVVRCYIHDNACSGVVSAGLGNTVADSVIANNTGATSDGIQLTGYAATVMNCTIHNNGRHGINGNQTFAVPFLWNNNVITGNGGFGAVGFSAAGFNADPMNDGNAYNTNSSGLRSNMDDTSSNPVDGVAAYARTDVTLTGLPYAGSGNFALNNTAGAGAACRAAARSPAAAGLSSVGYLDLGAQQHQDSGGASVAIPPPPVSGHHWFSVG